LQAVAWKAKIDRSILKYNKVCGYRDWLSLVQDGVTGGAVFWDVTSFSFISYYEKAVFICQTARHVIPVDSKVIFTGVSISNVIFMTKFTNI
jgi:hypothetical protein